MVSWASRRSTSFTTELPQGIVPASGPLSAIRSGSVRICSEGREPGEPADQVSSGFDWTPELAPEIGIAPGTVPVRAVASLGDPPSPQSPTYREITAESSIQIVGEAPSIVSAGQAVDAALASDAVSRWLSNQRPQDLEWRKPLAGRHWLAHRTVQRVGCPADLRIRHRRIQQAGTVTSVRHPATPHARGRAIVGLFVVHVR